MACDPPISTFFLPWKESEARVCGRHHHHQISTEVLYYYLHYELLLFFDHSLFIPQLFNFPIIDPLIDSSPTPHTCITHTPDGGNSVLQPFSLPPPLAAPNL
jgi:hypothetical protein